MNDSLKLAAAAAFVGALILGVFYAPFVTSIVTAGLLVGILVMFCNNSSLP